MNEQKICILYVDDETDLLKLGKLFLERFGNINVDISPSAHEALEKIAIGNYDGIVSDYQMPEMDGIQFLQEVRARFGDIPFILFTGRGREEVVIQAINHGADFYLQKGGEPKSQFVELEHKIRQAVSRREAEHALIESEQTSRALLDATTDAVALLTQDLIILSANDAFAHRFDKQIEDLIGKELHELVSPEFAQNRKVRVNEVIRTKQPVRFEDIRDEIFLENSIYPIFDGQGDVTLLAFYSRDVSAKKHAERDLQIAYDKIAADEEELREKYDELARSEKQVRESEEKFRSLTENSLDTIMLFDSDLRHVYVNPNIESQVGIPASEFIGKTHAELGFPPDLTRLFEETLRSVFQTGQTRQIECMLQSGIWIDWLVVPVHNLENRVEQVITSARDITERKKAEEHIRLADFSIEHSEIPTIWFNEQAQIIRANRAHCDALGYTREEMSHLTVHDFDPWYPPESWNQIWQRIKEQKHVIIESEHKRKDGTLFPVEISSSFFEYEGRQICISYAHNISERKKNEEELRSAFNQIAASEEILQRNYQELLQSESALRESEHRLADIINFAPDATLAIDVQGKIVAWNHAIEKFTGIHASEMLGKGDYEYSIPFYGTRKPILLNLLSDPLTELQRRYSNIHREDDTLIGEATIHLLSGEEKVVWIKASPLYDNEHRAIGAIESMRDITEWKRTTEALVKSEAWFRSLFDQAFQLAGVLDLEGRVTLANKTALTLIGENIDTILGRFFWETPWWAHSEEEQERVRDAVELAKKGETIRFETTHTDTEGRLHTIDFLIKPIIDGNGVPIALLPEGRDITEIKKIEADLRRSQGKIMAFFNHTHDSIFIHNEVGTILEVNTTMCQMYRVQPDEAVQYSIQDYTGPDSSLIEAKQHWDLALSGIDQVFYVQARRPKDGTLFDVEVFLTRIDGEEGPIILANVRDMTAARQAERALRESEHTYRGIFNSIQQGIYILDREGKFIDVNAGAELMYGYHRDEFFSQTPEFLSAPERNNIPSMLELLNKAFLGEPQVFEFWGHRKNGDIIPQEIRLFKGEYFGQDVIVATDTDISERKRAEEEILFAEQRLQTLINNIPLLAIQGYRMDGTTIYWHDTAEQLYGYSPEEAIGKNLLDLIIPPEMHDTVRDTITYMNKTGLPIPPAELCLVRKDGTRVPVFSTHAILANRIGENELFCFDIDLTWQKKTEHAIRKANRKLNLLTSITRHDINNQITVLQGNLDIIEESELRPDIKQAFSNIRYATNKIASMIAFTKEYEDIGANMPKWLNVAALIHLVMNDPLLSRVSIICDIEENLEVLTDPLMVKVWYNLIENAVRYGEKITTIHFFAENSTQDLILVCEDDGIGIKAEEKEKIFEFGYGKNTGLGLALSREILGITEMKIRETGDETRGARFEIVVPAGKFRRTGQDLSRTPTHQVP